MLLNQSLVRSGKLDAVEYLSRMPTAKVSALREQVSSAESVFFDSREKLRKSKALLDVVQQDLAESTEVKIRG